MEKLEFDINSLPLSESVRTAIRALPPGEPACAWTIVAEILKLHPEYGRSMAESIRQAGGPAEGRSQTVSEWFQELAGLFDLDRVKWIDGQLVIWGLAQLNEDVKGYLQPSGFLEVLEQEYKNEKRIPPAELVRKRKPAVEQSVSQSAVPAETPPVDAPAELKRVESIADPLARVEAWLQLLPQLPKGKQKNVAFEALDAVGTIKDPSFQSSIARVDALLKLLPYLPKSTQENVAREALDAVGIIKDPSFQNSTARVGALLQLLPHLSKSTQENVALGVLDAVGAVEDSSARVDVYAKLLPYLPKEIQTDVAREALQELKRVEDLSSRSRAASQLLSYLPDGEEKQRLVSDFPGAIGEVVSSVAQAARERPAPPAFSPPVAAVFSDRPDEDQRDLLDIQHEVANLANVLMYKSVEPPLALGLFGDWGSGKTFFMGKLKKYVGQMAKYWQKQETEGKQAMWCTRVAQIDFNAWHFSDANLWASLVTRIYEGLDSELAGDKKVAEKIKGQILGVRVEEAKKKATEAESRLNQAQRRVEEAQAGLEQRRQERESKKEGAGELIGDLPGVLKGAGLDGPVQQAAELMGVPEAARSYEALEQLNGEMQSLSGRVKAVAANVRRAPRSVWLVALLALVIPVVVTLGIERWGGQLSEIGKWVTEVSAFLIYVIGWLREPVRRVLGLVGKVESAVKAARLARQERIENDPQVVEAKKKVAEAQAEVQAANNNLEARRAEVQRLEEELQELRPERKLQRLIESRASSGAYAQHLGIISLIRADFESMSGILEELVDQHAKMVAEHTQLVTKQTELEAEQEQLEAKHVRKGTKRAQEAAEHAQELAEHAQLVAKHREEMEAPPIQRIILYIDDLDRCKPERVVEVLEALHLLLYFKLFVVVVAVDPRWLRHSLREHYSATLSERGGALSMDGGAAMSPYSTPQDYLEKIFQIPFALRPVEKTGYQKLVGELLKPLREKQASVARTPAPVRPAGGGNGRTPEEAGGGELAGGTVTTVETKSVGPSGLEVGGAQEEETPAEDEYTPIPARQLEFKKWEKTDIEQLWRMFRTPRTVKRFINIYRLLRAGLPSEEAVRRFEGAETEPGEYQAALLLLAAITGFPNEAGRFLSRLDAWLDERELEQKREKEKEGENPVGLYAWQEVIRFLKVAPPVPAQAPVPPRPGQTTASPKAGEQAEEEADAWELLLGSLEQVMQDGAWKRPFKVETLRYWSTRAARFSFCVQPA